MNKVRFLSKIAETASFGLVLAFTLTIILFTYTISFAVPDEREHFYGKWTDNDFTTIIISPDHYHYTLDFGDINPIHNTFIIQTWRKTEDGYVLYFENNKPLPFLLIKTKYDDIIIKQTLVDIFGNPCEPEVFYRVKR